jgi:hypothetical protein
MVTPTSAVIRWDTLKKNGSVVRYGLSPDKLDKRAVSAGLAHYHEVKLTGLSPATRYYYSVGTSTATFEKGQDYFFITQPPVGEIAPTRIWVIGDSGRGNPDQRKVYQGYQTFNGNRYTDLWLMLGDNAYGSGTYRQYQERFFDIYPSLLRRQRPVVWRRARKLTIHTITATSIWFVWIPLTLTAARMAPWRNGYKQTLPRIRRIGSLPIGITHRTQKARTIPMIPKVMISNW